MINTQQYLMLKEILKENMEEDEHGKSNICNIYFDTEQYELIRHSTSLKIKYVWEAIIYQIKKVLSFWKLKESIRVW